MLALTFPDSSYFMLRLIRPILTTRYSAQFKIKGIYFCSFEQTNSNIALLNNKKSIVLVFNYICIKILNTTFYSIIIIYSNALYLSYILINLYTYSGTFIILIFRIKRGTFHFILSKIIIIMIRCKYIMTPDLI